jgi:hypothetical protein
MHEELHLSFDAWPLFLLSGCPTPCAECTNTRRKRPNAIVAYAWSVAVRIAAAAQDSLRHTSTRRADVRGFSSELSTLVLHMMHKSIVQLLHIMHSMSFTGPKLVGSMLAFDTATLDG